MIVINNISSTKFSFNGIPYWKNFLPQVKGQKIQVVNNYDDNIILTDYEMYSDYIVDGITYASVALLQDALLPILYTRASLAGASNTLQVNSTENVNRINFEGATVTDEGSGVVTVAVEGGSRQVKAVGLTYTFIEEDKTKILIDALGDEVYELNANIFVEGDTLIIDRSYKVNTAPLTLGANVILNESEFFESYELQPFSIAIITRMNGDDGVDEGFSLSYQTSRISNRQIKSYNDASPYKIIIDDINKLLVIESEEDIVISADIQTTNNEFHIKNISGSARELLFYGNITFEGNPIIANQGYCILKCINADFNTWSVNTISEGGDTSITDVTLGTAINGFTAETPVDADTITFSDVSDSNKAKKVTFANLKAFLKTYFDTLYATASSITTALATFKTDNFLDATSSIQNQIDSKANLTQVANLIRQEFTFTGSQTFTLSSNYGQVYSVEVQGQGALSTTQYTLVSPNQITINDTLDSGDYVVVLYSNAIVGLQPYYSQAQVDALVTNSIKVWKSGIDGVSVANTLTITPTYTQLIPANTFVAGDVVELLFRATINGNKSSVSNIYIYVNTTSNLSGTPIQLGIFTSATTTRTLQMERTMSVKGTTSKVIQSNATGSTDTNLTGFMTTLNIDWTINQYFVFAIGHTVADQTLFGDFYRIIKN